MTEEEMKEALQAAQGEIESLKATNKQLKTEKTDAARKASAAETAAEDAKEEALRKAGDIAALEKSLNEKHSAAIKIIEAERDAARSETRNLKIDSAIKKAMIENNVQAHMIEPLTSMFKAGASIDDGKDAQVVYDGKELASYLKGYFGTEVGMRYVEASGATGGGATGSNKNAADQWTQRPTTQAELTAFGKLANENPAYYNSLVDKFEMGDAFKV